MPIYEYQCSKCGVFEVTQRITEDPLKKCPTCSGKVQKLISNTSFQLKGTGWYVTDYGRGSGTNANGEKPASESKPNGTSGSSDSTQKATTTKPSGDKNTSGANPSS